MPLVITKMQINTDFILPQSERLKSKLNTNKQMVSNAGVDVGNQESLIPWCFYACPPPCYYVDLRQKWHHKSAPLL